MSPLPSPPKCPLRPHPGALLPAGPVPRMEVAGPAPSCAGWAPMPQFPHQSQGSLPPSLPWGGGTRRTQGEEELRWPPCGDRDMATSSRGHGTKPEAPGIYTRASRLLPRPDRELPKVPFRPQICHVAVTQPRAWGGCPDPATPPPFAAGEEVAGEVRSGSAGSCPSSSAAFGDHLPVPLLLLHQPGREQAGGLKDPPKRDLPKSWEGDTLTCGCGLR